MKGDTRKEVGTEGLVDSIVTLAKRLISIPTQGGLDSPVPALEVIQSWLSERGLPSEVLHSSNGRPVGLLCDVGIRRQGETLCLAACIDTAPFGDLGSWQHHPVSAVVEDGWLYGRGSADSKTAVSAFCHIALALHKISEQIPGVVSFFFDGDEHTGEFGGIKAYVERHPEVKGVFIGYPGSEAVCTGARGIYRAKVSVYGTSSHSGALQVSKTNAIVKAALLVERLSRVGLEQVVDDSFGLPAKLSVTEISGGRGYSIVPDKCDLKVDLRLTPSFTDLNARKILTEAVNRVDDEYPTRKLSEIHAELSWPAYKLTDGNPLVSTLIQSAREHFARHITQRVCGPSNIGNYLSQFGVDAVCGFGLTYKNIHAPNECIAISTVRPLYHTYLNTVYRLATRH